eukprot:Blabericola_migrator_1__8768@NODE_461_length_8293_cov_107_238877_g360_i0_p1_GENE_NODE_461_length_8293_cov_107_238877_g360_i0NODE_461_length_8293_cov_107_238877_g360_i0_p1_ORF_typecomplete_len904_score197_74CRAL_TRIO/PF00650_20/0_1CRAL_TRIO/PF00650_20/1_9e13_NODE_461_length_8293_cov_107_238877_g360_i038916602
MPGTPTFGFSTPEGDEDIEIPPIQILGSVSIGSVVSVPHVWTQPSEIGGPVGSSLAEASPIAGCVRPNETQPYTHPPGPYIRPPMPYTQPFGIESYTHAIEGIDTLPDGRFQILDAPFDVRDNICTEGVWPTHPLCGLNQPIVSHLPPPEGVPPLPTVGVPLESPPTELISPGSDEIGLPSSTTNPAGTFLSSSVAAHSSDPDTLDPHTLKSHIPKSHTLDSQNLDPDTLKSHIRESSDTPEGSSSATAGSQEQANATPSTEDVMSSSPEASLDHPTTEQSSLQPEVHPLRTLLIKFNVFNDLCVPSQHVCVHFYPTHMPKGAVSPFKVTDEFEYNMLKAFVQLHNDCSDFSYETAIRLASPPLCEVFKFLKPILHTCDTPSLTRLNATDFQDTMFDPSLNERGTYHLRMMRANDFDTEETLANMIYTRLWFCTRGYRAQSRQEMSPLLQTGGFYIFGHDIDMRPVLYCRLDRLARVCKRLCDTLCEGGDTPSDTPPHDTIIDLLVMYGGYYFIWFARHLQLYKRAEQMVMVCDYGDMLYTEEIWIVSCVGPAIRALLCLFPLFVHPIFVVDSSQQRQIPQLNGLVLKHLLTQPVCKTLVPSIWNLTQLHTAPWLLPTQREVQYGGLCPSVCVFDLPVSADDIHNQIMSQRAQYRDVQIKGNLRLSPKQQKKPPKILLIDSAGGATQLSDTDNFRITHPYHISLWNTSEIARMGSNIEGYLQSRTYQMCRFASQTFGTVHTASTHPFNTPPPVYWHGRDRKGRPNLIIHAMSLTSLKRSLALDLLDFWLQWGLEYLMSPGEVETWNVIIKTDKTSILTLPSLMTHVTHFKDTYPDRLCRMFFVGGTILTAVSAWMSNVTPDKVVIVKSIEDDLFLYIHSSQLDMSIGGRCNTVVEDGYVVMPR